MAYWHMQLHPNDLNWKREEELLENLSLVGLGLTSESQTKNFIKNVKMRDIVLIKRGSKPIALVEINGELEDNFKNDLTALDWFQYRKKVKILDIFNKSKLDSSDRPRHDFPSPRGTLTSSKDKTSPTYKYILDWHKSLFPELYQTSDSIKIREIGIHNFKIFKNFKIDFTSKDNKPLPIVVIAGINGSGKTTLLEYIEHFTNIVDDSDRSYLKLERYDKQTQDIKLEELRFYNLWNIKKNSKEESFLSKLFKEKTIYFPTDKSIEDIKEFMPKYLEDMIYKEDIKASEAFQKVEKYIDEIFKDLNLLIKFDSRDGKGNLFFKNKKGEKFSIDEISTGEKTLLSKVLYLYLKGIKDSVILIDEPELSLHPAWQNRVLKLYESFAKENNCQIIIATHSPHIIGSAKKEYVRLLVKNGDNIDVVDEFSQSYGLEFSMILTDIMGVEHLRVPEVDEKLTKVKKMIAQSNFNTIEFEQKWKELEEVLGKDYLDLKLLKLEIASRKKHVSNN